MRRPFGERGAQQPLGLDLLDQGLEAQRRSSTRARTAAASSSGGQRAVEQYDPLGKALGELLVRPADLGLEAFTLALDPVGRALLAAGGGGGIDGEHERAVGQQALEHRQVELEDTVETEAARDALVGERRVDVAVGDDVCPAVESRPDHLGGVLGP